MRLPNPAPQFRSACGQTLLLALLLALLLTMLTPFGKVYAQTPPAADDTAALQARLDQAGKTGGEVALEARAYRINGSLTVPTGVTLRGSWAAPHHGAWDKGTTLLITGGRGQENGTPAITLRKSSALRGVTLLWPEETPDNIVPYPWAVHGSGMHNTVENVTLVNAYQGIKIGQPWSELHLIRNVFGCVLRRGIFVDETSDVGRIENVHFNTHYWVRSGYPAIQAKDDEVTSRLVTEFTRKNLEGFVFGRTDWEYVANTFVWGAHIGYRFIHTAAGECNGQFTGIGADACGIGLRVDQLQPIGIQVTNGEFTAFGGAENAGIVISPGAAGAAQFVNCNFWSTPGGAARLHGSGPVTFSACHFADGADGGVIASDGGSLTVSACTFGARGSAVTLKPGLRSAIITANSQPGGLQIDNGIGEAAQIGLNEAPRRYAAALTAHSFLKIGSPGDDDFLGDGWYGGEAAGEAPDTRLTTARWTSGNAVLRLPVTPGAAYTLTLWLLTRPATPPQTVSVGLVKAAVAVGQNQRLVLSLPASVTRGRSAIAIRIAGGSWSPASLERGSTDTRRLGARVFGVELEAVRGPASAVVLNDTP